MPREDEYTQSFDNVVRSTFLSSLGDVTLKDIDDVLEDTDFNSREVLCDVPCFPANSSFIIYVGYNPAQKILELRFKNSSHGFRYREFSQDDWNDFVSTGSFGSYFHKHIKGNYEWVKIDAELKKITTNEL